MLECSADRQEIRMDACRPGSHKNGVPELGNLSKYNLPFPALQNLTRIHRFDGDQQPTCAEGAGISPA